VKAIPPGEASSLEAIQKQLADIQLSLQSLKAQDTELRLRKLESEITGIREQLGRMEASLKSSKAESRTSFSISPPASPTTTGTIRLSNTSAYYASVNIGGLLYRVAPGQVLPIANQPAGDFKYDVQADGFGLIQSLLGLEVFALARQYLAQLIVGLGALGFGLQNLAQHGLGLGQLARTHGSLDVFGAGQGQRPTRGQGQGQGEQHALQPRLERVVHGAIL
jgi:hypothetical protein